MDGKFEMIEIKWYLLTFSLFPNSDDFEFVGV